MITPQQVHRLALALPEASEQDHHGFPSFRVGGKIFATQPDDEHLHVMLGVEETDAAVLGAPHAVEELWWGKQLSGIRVTLSGASGAEVKAWLTQAWRRRAPARLLKPFDGSGA